MGGKCEAFSGTTIKDIWTKPMAGGIRGGRWRWMGLVEGRWGEKAPKCT